MEKRASLDANAFNYAKEVPKSWRHPEISGRPTSNLQAGNLIKELFMGLQLHMDEDAFFGVRGFDDLAYSQQFSVLLTLPSCPLPHLPVPSFSPPRGPQTVVPEL